MPQTGHDVTQVALGPRLARVKFPVAFARLRVVSARRAVASTMAATACMTCDRVAATAVALQRLVSGGN